MKLVRGLRVPGFPLVDLDTRFLAVAANALSEAADELKRDNDFADMPKQKFCREHGCPCKTRCETECYAKMEGL